MTIPGFYLNGYLSPEFDFPPDENDQRIRIEHRERLTASLLNIREISLYQQYELQNGQQWLGQNYAFRTVFDCVALNSGNNIAIGTTTLTLSATTVPPLILFANSIVPLYATIAGTGTDSKFYFNGPQFGVVFDNSTPTAQKIVITNNTGVALTQCYFVFNYLKT